MAVAERVQDLNSYIFHPDRGGGRARSARKMKLRKLEGRCEIECSPVLPPDRLVVGPYHGLVLCAVCVWGQDRMYSIMIPPPLYSRQLTRVARIEFNYWGLTGVWLGWIKLITCRFSPGSKMSNACVFQIKFALKINSWRRRQIHFVGRRDTILDVRRTKNARCASSPGMSSFRCVSVLLRQISHGPDFYIVHLCARQPLEYIAQIN